jgi:hypothetical protein
MASKTLVETTIQNHDTLDYREYLQTDHWRNLRNKIVKERKACALCSLDSSLQVHHIRYRRNKKSILFDERDSDLVLLCEWCHELWHLINGKTILSKRKINRVVNLFFNYDMDMEDAIAACITKAKYRAAIRKLESSK